MFIPRRRLVKTRMAFAHRLQADKAELKAVRAAASRSPFGRHERVKGLSNIRYGLRTAPAVASSVINPLIKRPFSAALIAATLARPTAAPMVRALAGTCSGILVMRPLVPPPMTRP